MKKSHLLSIQSCGQLSDFIVRNGEWLRPYTLSDAEKKDMGGGRTESWALLHQMLPS